MPSFTIRPAVAADVDAVLAFWRAAAEDTNRSDTREGVHALLARDPDGLVLAEDTRGIGRGLLDSAEQRFAALGARRVDAMVLADNELGQQAWVAACYERQPEWSRWVKFLPKAASELGPGPEVRR